MCSNKHTIKHFFPPESVSAARLYFLFHPRPTEANRHKHSLSQSGSSQNFSQTTWVQKKTKTPSAWSGVVSLTWPIGGGCPGLTAGVVQQSDVELDDWLLTDGLNASHALSQTPNAARTVGPRFPPELSLPLLNKNQTTSSPVFLFFFRGWDLGFLRSRRTRTAARFSLCSISQMKKEVMKS